MHQVGDTLTSLTTTCQSIITRRGIGTDARILRVDEPAWRTSYLDAHERGSWYWLSVLIGGEWHQVARRRDPRDLVGVASRLTPEAVGGLNFKESKKWSLAH